MNSEPRRWDNLVGKDGQEAADIIKRETGFTNVEIMPPNTPVTMDYRTDRVRIHVDANGKVKHPPGTG